MSYDSVRMIEHFPEVIKEIQLILQQQFIPFEHIIGMVESEPISTKSQCVFRTKEKNLSSYVFVTFKFPDYCEYALDALINTGSTTSSARKNALFNEWWKPLNPLIALCVANGEASLITH